MGAHVTEVAGRRISEVRTLSRCAPRQRVIRRLLVFLSLAITSLVGAVPAATPAARSSRGGGKHVGLCGAVYLGETVNGA